MTKYISAVKAWREAPVNTICDLEQRLDNFRVLFAYHSGKIENNEITYHDTREIFENGKVLSFTGTPRTIFEQQNQKLCYEYLKDKIVKQDSLTQELICEVHKILTAGTYDERRFIENGERPGEYKKHDYVTGRNEVGTSAEKVSEEIAELLCEINSFKGNNILKVATYFHAVFENIHPFADGNGRVGRTLLNYFLLIHNHPPLIVYDEDKILYYEALEKYDTEEVLEPLYSFFEFETEKTWAVSNNSRKNHKKLTEISL